MKSLDERLNGLRWRFEAMRRLWSGEARPDMTFLPSRPPESGAIGQIEHPPAGVEIDASTLVVAGWVTFEAGPTERVEIWLDERPLGRARLGIPSIYPLWAEGLPHAPVSGFELAVDAGQAPPSGPGGSRLRAVAHGPAGETQELEPVSIVIPAAEPPPPNPAPAPVPIPAGATEKGLRLLVVTHQLNLGGAQLYLMDLLHGLAAKGGFQPTVVSTADGALRGELEAMGIPVHLTSFSEREDLNSHLGRIEELTTWMAPRQFDLALVNTATSLVSPVAEAAAQLEIATIWAIHESFEPGILWASLDPAVRARTEATLAGAAFAVFEAEATRRIYEPLVPAERCRVLPYGLDFTPIDAKRDSFDNAAARRETSLPEDATVVVCVGTVEPRKAQIPLAEAFDRIAERHPDAHLILVGGRTNDLYSQALEDFIAASPHGGRMRLIPVTPEVDTWYGIADLLVCASDVESLPRTVLEAMAWETPVLATEVFGLPELIDHGETGWLCEPGNLGALAEALNRALRTSAEERERIGAAARQLVKRRHSLPEYASSIAQLLDRARSGTEPGQTKR